MPGCRVLAAQFAVVADGLTVRIVASTQRASRNKFATQYIDDFYAVWRELGIDALRNAAIKQPAKFIMVAASLIPQHFKFEHEHKKLVGQLRRRRRPDRVRERWEEPICLKFNLNCFTAFAT